MTDRYVTYVPKLYLTYITKLSVTEIGLGYILSSFFTHTIVSRA